LYLWRHTIPKKDSDENHSINKTILELTQRVQELERKLDEKDRELREVSIQRSEFIAQLNEIINYLRKEDQQKNSIKLIEKTMADNKTISSSEPKANNIGISKFNNKIHDKAEGNEHKLNDELLIPIDDKIEHRIGGKMDMLDTFESDKLDFMGKYSYRERMILMNRIDIYRLFVTVIIISSQIKYPRAITKPEENDLKTFIEELNEFENLLLDLNLDENLIWEKGKVCEKHAIQLFTRFFNI
jgi:hypothetical protein